MTDLFENPMGLMGFEFVEFASPTPNTLEPFFEKLGFELVARHRSKDVVLYRQGDINFIVNREPHSPAAYFAAEHGPSACGMAFRVKDSHKAYARALELGAQPIEIATGPMELRLPAIKGIGGAPLYLIDRFEDGKSIYDIDFEFVEGVERYPVGHGLKLIDHLTHNVYRGRMTFWANFYEKLFNFREIRYFDIQGEYTGLTSKALTAPDGKIRIPLNEASASRNPELSTCRWGSTRAMYCRRVSNCCPEVWSERGQRLCGGALHSERSRASRSRDASSSWRRTARGCWSPCRRD